MTRQLRRRPEIAMAAVAIAVMALTGSAMAADGGDGERIEKLEREVADLRAAIEELRLAGVVGGRLDEIERRLGILAEEVENLKVGEDAIVASGGASVPGLGPAASKVYRKESGLSIGGYGEALFESLDSTRDDGSESGTTDQFDLLRGVLYFGYKFSDSFVFNSELEFEHSSTSESGSASVEFAYVDYLHSDVFNIRGGLLLVPMGFINELHEPTVFLGAKRPETERRIIPTTWRENGAGVFGDLGGLTYRSYVVNSFDASGFSAGGLRGGRQKGSKAKAEDFAWVGRLDWTGTPGLMIGGSVFAGDSGQDLVAIDGGDLDVSTVIFEGHLDYRYRGFEMRALYARADLDDVAELNRTLGLEGGSSVGAEMEGYYLQAGVDVFARRSGSSALIPFARWERIDTQRSVPDGWQASPENDAEILTVGLVYQPIEQLVLKLDWQDVGNEAGTGIDQFSLGLGYIF